VPGQANRPKPHAVILGAVFVDPGLSFPGVEVVLSRKDGAKWKRIAQQDTTARGEFSFELPPSAATYLIRSSPKGYKPDEKEVAIAGEDRVETNLVLVKLTSEKEKK